MESVYWFAFNKIHPRPCISGNYLSIVFKFEQEFYFCVQIFLLKTLNVEGSPRYTVKGKGKLEKCVYTRLLFT